MTLHSDHGDLSPGEGRAYQSADRETPIDPGEEERTVQYLRARGVFGGDGLTARPVVRTEATIGRRVWRATALAGAAAAAVLAAFMEWAPPRRAPTPALTTVARVSESTAVPAPYTTVAAQPPRKSSLLVWY